MWIGNLPNGTTGGRQPHRIRGDGSILFLGRVSPTALRVAGRDVENGGAALGEKPPCETPLLTREFAHSYGFSQQ